MRVLMTADAVGGVWTYALELAAGLIARGDEVALAVLGPPVSAAQRGEADAVAGLRLIETGLPLDWTADGPEGIAVAARGLSGLAAAERPHLIHLNSPALAADLAGEAPVVGVAHSCLATWWSAVRSGPPPADFAWRIAATARGYAACDALLAPSAAFAAATRAAYGLEPIVVHNGRSAGAPAKPDARDVAVLTAGRLWDEGKDVATLDAAAARLGPGRTLVAVGPVRGPQGQAVGLDRCDARGVVSSQALSALLGRTRVFASAAVYEPFGLAVLEAAQAGCALILSDIPTFRELWSGAAAFVPPRDAAAFARAIDALLDDPAERDRLGGAARIRAERYDTASCVARTAAVHAAVVGGKRPRAAA